MLVDDERKAILVGIGNERRMPVCERCNVEIGYDEVVCRDVKKMIGGRSP